MLYLIDAGVLITANNSYYPLDRVPEFWTWVLHHAKLGKIKVPLETFTEVADGDDGLAKWVKTKGHKDCLLLDENSNPAHVSHVIEKGYADDLNDIELISIGRDPFLIAYGLDDVGRCVITTEVSKPSRTRHRRHVPDVCRDLKVPCADIFHLIGRLDFRTSWNADWD